MPSLPTVNASVSLTALVVFLLGHLGLSFIQRLERLVSIRDFVLEFSSMHVCLVKSLEIEEPSVDLDNYLEPEKTYVVIVAEAPAVAIRIFETWCKCRPFAFTVPSNY